MTLRKKQKNFQFASNFFSCFYKCFENYAKIRKTKNHKLPLRTGSLFSKEKNVNCTFFPQNKSFGVVKNIFLDIMHQFFSFFFVLFSSKRFLHILVYSIQF